MIFYKPELIRFDYRVVDGSAATWREQHVQLRALPVLDGEPLGTDPEPIKVNETDLVFFDGCLAIAGMQYTIVDGLLNAQAGNAYYVTVVRIRP